MIDPREAAIRAATDALAEALVAVLAQPPISPEPERLYSIPEAAGRLGIGRTALYGELTAGRLASIKVGRRRLIAAAALAEYVRGAS